MSEQTYHGIAPGDAVEYRKWVTDKAWLPAKLVRWMTPGVAVLQLPNGRERYQMHYDAGERMLRKVQP